MIFGFSAADAVLEPSSPLQNQRGNAWSFKLAPTPATICLFANLLSPCRAPPMPAPQDAKMAVDTGYWPLYRYQPPMHKPHEDGVEPARGVLSLDSKKLKGDLEAFLSRENR